LLRASSAAPPPLPGIAGVVDRWHSPELDASPMLSAAVLRQVLDAFPDNLRAKLVSLQLFGGAIPDQGATAFP
jgi:hypothetical protein